MTFPHPSSLKFFVLAILLAASHPTFADGFIAAASMHQARFGHTATLLQNGKVLVTGGGTIDDLLATSELYDPASDTWTTSGALKTAREYHTATLLNSGKVLVVGGSQFGVPLQSAELYDPATGTWSQAGTPTSKRVRHSASLLPSGSVFVAFGTTGKNGTTPTASTELYDPSTNAWTAVGSAPGGSGAARSYHQAALVSSGAQLIVFAGADASGNPRNDGAIYTTAGGGWVGPFALMTTPRYLFTASASAGAIIAAGGYSTSGATASAESYLSNQWHSAGTMTSPRYAHTATVLDAAGDILVTGGVATDTSLASAEIYEPVSNTWTATTNSMSIGRAQHTATLLGAGRVLVCGGQTGSGATAVETETCDKFIVDSIYHNGFEQIPN
jgi:hypothetical protein